ncbi:hypothetical protein BAE44_0000487 [Dichanthelium oligosanthes]|uniref:Uncharacterized protein n=1 Tax=Dichanthelium oligosanthes TaxID=888268 RepID=A0A1E5WM71_9POAL|nr:hypothetical protein BAE44_0000487 [Dichanthelium oligosanthes]
MLVLPAAWYQEASMRLPLQEIPDLVGCIHAGGLSIGLADPVTNIILNAISLLPNDGEQPPPSQPKTCGWFQMATQSYAGHCTFMTAYFRYLSGTQARLYLYLAMHDLLAAIKLVHYDRLPSPPWEKICLLPDGGQIKAALRAAALQAEHPAPDVLAGLMTAQYPAPILSRVLAKVQNKRLLSPGDVLEVRALLDLQWPPNPPPTNIEFRCRPGGFTCAPCQDGKLVFTSPLDLEEGYVATVMISRDVQRDEGHQYLADLMSDERQMDARIPSSTKEVIGILRSQQQDGEVDYDDRPCEHMLSLKMSLLDTIYAFYIKALARLPSSTRSARLIRALLVAGHCYGPMDPVSNIILSTIWYDIAFGVDVESSQGILSTRPLCRMVSRSLAGLVAIIRLTCRSEHEALHHINTSDCDLSTNFDRVDCESPSSPDTAFNKSTFFAVAAKDAKHPQHVAFVSFLVSLSDQKVAVLSHFLHSSGGRISDADWDLLNNFLRDESECHVVPMSAQKDMEAPRRLFSFASFEMFHPSASLMMPQSASPIIDKLPFVRTELNKLLREYCYQHPWEPTYQLDVICGVMESSRSYHHGHPKLYHANFMASKGDDTSPQPEATLFFAEFWGRSLSEIVQLKPSSCRPIRNHSYTGEPSFLQLKL